MVKPEPDYSRYDGDRSKDKDGNDHIKVQENTFKNSIKFVQSVVFRFSASFYYYFKFALSIFKMKINL